jgi:hypothetical protein
MSGDHATSLQFNKFDSHGADRTTGSSHEDKGEFMSSRVQMPVAAGKIISLPPVFFTSTFYFIVPRANRINFI